MNIFATSPCPIQSAKWLCDKHLKMGLESCQLLATCFTLDRLAKEDCPRTQKGTARKHFNPKHPSCLFTTHNRSNMRWVIDHTEAIFQEKYERYPKGGRHFSHDFLDWVRANVADSIVPEGELTDFTVAISADKNCRQINGFDKLPVIEQYRRYIIHDKPFATWPEGKTPPWIPQIDISEIW